MALLEEEPEERRQEGDKENLKGNLGEKREKREKKEKLVDYEENHVKNKNFIEWLYFIKFMFILNVENLNQMNFSFRLVGCLVL